MGDANIVIVDQGQPPAETKARPKKPAKKRGNRLKELREKDPDFIGKFELARHLQCHIGTLTDWIADGTIPPPWFRPGTKHPVWLRRHYTIFKRTRRWPDEAFWNRRDQRTASTAP